MTAQAVAQRERGYDHLSREELVSLLERRDREGARLGLNWATDKAAIDQALNADFVTLRLDLDLSDPSRYWPNLIIEGDNFDALRWLRMTMPGRVKCIYVDPPYNTGAKDWVYNDHYHQPGDFFQTTWLEFLHRRFVLARDLLSDDGVMLVSINDRNRALLELMLDQTLPGMRIGSFTWRTRAGTKGEGAMLSQDNEHVLVFANPRFRFGGTPVDISKYTLAAGDSEPSLSVALQTNKNYLQRPNSYFAVQNARTGLWYPCNPDRTWSFQTRNHKGAKGQTFEDMYEGGVLLFSREGESQRFATMDELLRAIDAGTAHPYLRRGLPRLEEWVGRDIGLGSVRKKQLLSEMKSSVKAVSSWIRSSGDDDDAGDDKVILKSGMTQEGTSRLRSILGADAFPYPKPPSLIRELLRQSTVHDSVVVDFFAGSGTTADAVMQLNAEDDGDRRFVLVSHDEATIDAPDRNLARDVMAQRVRRLNALTENPFARAPFAYLRTNRVAIESLLDDGTLEPEDIWLAVQCIHDMAITPYEVGADLQQRVAETAIVAYCDHVTEPVIERVRAQAAAGRALIIYCWTPGPLLRALEGLPAEVRRLPHSLTERFLS